MRWRVGKKLGGLFILTAILIGFFGNASTREDYTRHSKSRGYKKEYERARLVAVKKYGDKKEPLTNWELNSWYNEMNIHPGLDPSIYNLRIFVERNQNKE